MIADIVADACASTGLSRADLLGTGRGAHLAHVRFAVAWSARTVLGYSHARIAATLYPRSDHTASVHACQRAEAMIPINPGFARLARKLAERASARASLAKLGHCY